MASLQQVISKALSAGMERPAAWALVQAEGAAADINEFRAAFRRQQKAFNNKPVKKKKKS